MHKKKKQKQFQRMCIFCGGKGLSEQHVLPAWLLRTFPENIEGYTQMPTTISLRDGNIYIDSTKWKYQQGALGNARLKIVCKKCNNEWMSAIEAHAKEYMMQLINHTSIRITDDIKTKLSAWVMLMTIMYEYTQLSTKTIKREDRLHLMETLTVPTENWEIWVANTDSSVSKRRLYHDAGQLSLSSDVQSASDIPKCNVQTTLIGIENVAFLASTDYFPIRERYVPELISSKFWKIWPLGNEGDKMFPSGSGLNHVELEDFLHSLKLKKLRL
jgi:hypothetical protein